MSKNHRHYVHLCTEERQDDSSLLSHMMDLCNQSQYVTEQLSNTFGGRGVAMEIN